VFRDAKRVPESGRFTPTRVILWLIAEDGGYATRTLRENVCAAALETKKPEWGRSGNGWWKAIAGVDDQRMPAAALDLVRRMFFDEKEGPCAALPDYVVEGAAQELGIDVEAAWQKEQCGPLTERYYSLHTKDQLLALSDEVGGCADSTLSKSDMVSALLNAPPKILPRELAGKKGK
jgi:hypothetical protein